MQRVAVVGAGAWGTALAVVARAAGREVRIWAREQEVVAAINSRHENTVFLPGVTLDATIRATPQLAEAARDADVLIIAVPAQFARAVTAELVPFTVPGVPAVVCAKGFEQATGALMTQVLAETLPAAPPAVLSGPTFAAEVAQGKPTAVTLACGDPATGRQLVAALGTPRFRPYYTPDLVGAQVGGAVKNVLAIACGIATGLGLGESARAALITRGLAETVRLGRALGAESETLMGLSGLGDLVLTCTSPQSRNMSLGIALGEGRALDQVLAERRSVAEGVFTAPAVLALAGRLGVEMPICGAVDDVLRGRVPIAAAIASLLGRPFTAEAPGA